MANGSEYKIENRYIPGSIGRIAEIHSTYYNEHWQFGLYFEGLDAAKHLYEEAGFKLKKQQRGVQWGT